MPREPGVLGVFREPAQAAAAVRQLRGAGHTEVRLATPAPYPELLEALGRPRSHVDGVVLLGAALGTAGGFALCVGTSLAWPLLTGGMPIVSIPPFVIIAFELAVLVGAFVNLVVLVTMMDRARRRRWFPADRRFCADRVGIFIPAGERTDAGDILRAAGAEEVSDVA